MASEGRLNQVLDKALSPFPEDIRGELYKKFTSYYNEPLTEQVEIVLGKRMTDEETRSLQFFPTRDQYKYYPQLIDSAPEKAPMDHPQAKVQRNFLPLFYLVHVQNQELVTEFILNQGLTVLARLIAHPNMQLRGQMIEIFITITSKDSWFDFPTTENERKLHFALLNLSNSNVFVPNLLLNRVYDGYSYYCLQILAFWLSWVRKFYCKDNQLRVSVEILEQLELWTEKNDSIQEKELAQKVFEDFNRFKIEGPDQLDGIQDQLQHLIQKRNKAMAASDFPTVITTSSQVLELNPNDIDSWSMRSRARLELNELELALEDADQGLTIDERHFDMLECKIQALGLLNRSDQVVGLKDQVVGLKSTGNKKLLDLIEIQRVIHEKCCEKLIKNEQEQRVNEIYQAILRRKEPTV